ncbi:hypothetical protein ACFFV7_41125 [Nonomuraea spiralis]|uniref:Uncharacterized protein n=1 Tax=Nonomuraea spiralis TaxID=46182 RepID=A0ABV5IT05_9ACTN|nr:hypothetical protein [Nonomuraea spiralis]GGT17201.1 hypothetical protein GCM10010176_072280 [Nonomuraea spiralis]
MELWHAGVYGALGGAVVELMTLWPLIMAWQAKRQKVRRKPRPALKEHIDLPAHALVALTRAVLGALVGLGLADQFAGPIAAFTAGAAAPLLLLQLGRVRSLAAAQNQAAALGEVRQDQGVQ